MPPDQRPSYPRTPAYGEGFPSGGAGPRPGSPGPRPSAPTGPLDRVMFTPQQVSLEHHAAAYGWEYRRLANRGELDAGLGASDAPTLIEVPLAR